jgi:hypothetical protein
MVRMLARASALLLALGPVSAPVSSPVPPRPAEERVSLHCARGTADYPDTELTLSASGPYLMQVVYVDYRPSRGRADWALRDCLRTASKLDASRPIVASLWVRERRRGSPRELILQCLTPALQSMPIAEASPPIMPACPGFSSP